MADVVVVEGAEPEPKPVEAAAVEAAEVNAEVVETTADASVEIAAIEADRDVELARINAESAATVVEAVAEETAASKAAEERYQECLARLSALETTMAEILARLTPQEPPPQESPPEAESVEVTPAFQEAPEEPARRRKPTRWI